MSDTMSDHDNPASMPHQSTQPQPNVSASQREMVAAIEYLAQQFAHSSAAVTTQAVQAVLQHAREHDPARGGLLKPQPPSRFAGASRSQEKAEQFVYSCEAYFRAVGNADDRAKIDFAVAQLTDHAATWVYSFRDQLNQSVDKRTSTWLKTWDAFTKEFLERFGDPMPAKTAADKLHTLRQVGSARDYATQFTTLANRLGEEYNKSPTKRYDFERGLKPEVKIALASLGQKVPDDFKSLADLAISIDEAQYKQRIARTPLSRFSTTSTGRPANGNSSSSSAQYSSSSSSSSSNGNGPTPMDLDAVHVIPRKGEHLSAEEKQRRRDNNLSVLKHRQVTVMTSPSSSPPSHRPRLRLRPS